MCPLIIGGLISWAVNLIIGLFVYFSNPKREINRKFAFFNICIGSWSLGSFLLNTIPDKNIALWILRLSYLFAILLLPTFLSFVYLLIGEKINKKIIWIGRIFSVFLISMLPSPLFIEGIYILPKDGLLISSPGPVYYIFVLGFGITAWVGFSKLILAIKTSSGAKGNQLRYITTAYFVATMAGLDYFLSVFKIFKGFPIDDYILVFSFSILAYVILRYRLMDIKVAFTRAGILAIVYTLVLGIPFWLGYRLLGRGLWILPVSIAVVFATLGPFIYNYLRRRTEDVILAAQRRYQEVLRRLSATLTLVKDLYRLLKLVVLRVARAVKVDFACVYLTEKDTKLIQKYPYTIKGFFPDFPKELSFDSSLVRYITSKRKPIFAEELVSMTDGFNLRSGLIVPSFVRKRLLGFLVLGPKTSGAIYTQEDANMFGILANQLALAIENSQFIDEYERTQAELFSKERMASLGTMAGGMTHQINNRFNAISMATSDTIDTLKFIEPNSCSQEAKEYLQQIKHALTRIQENALRGGKLVNDFLNFSQPDRLQKEAKIFNLPEPLERGIEMARIKTAFAEDTIQKEIQESPLLIRGSFEMIQDMYFNITDNAVDALDKKEKAIKNKELTLPEGGYKGRIIIRMFKQDPYIVTKIQDNGIGMAKEQLEKLFTPFFTTKGTAYKGTGLGFFVIYKIIEAHEGTIEVESEYGKGTTFTIKLPLAKEGE